MSKNIAWLCTESEEDFWRRRGLSRKYWKWRWVGENFCFVLRVLAIFYFLEVLFKFFYLLRKSYQKFVRLNPCIDFFDRFRIKKFNCSLTKFHIASLEIANTRHAFTQTILIYTELRVNELNRRKAIRLDVFLLGIEFRLGIAASVPGAFVWLGFWLWVTAVDVFVKFAFSNANFVQFF